jgi:hypothetical protein
MAYNVHGLLLGWNLKNVPPSHGTWLMKLNSIYNKNILLKRRANKC